MNIFNCTIGIETASHIAVCMGVFFGLLQLIIYKCERKQKKRQITIEFYNDLRKDFIESLNEIEGSFPGDKVVEILKVKDNKAMLEKIRTYLSCMERFSVGINNNVYDIKIFSKMIGTFFTVKWYGKLENIILFFCVKNNNPDAYKELKIFVKKLKKIQGKNACEQKLKIDKIKQTLNKIYIREEEGSA